MTDAPSLTNAVWWVADCRHCEREIFILAPRPRGEAGTDSRSTRCGECGQAERAEETLKARRHRE